MHLDETQMHYVKQKGQIQKAIHCVIPFIWYSGNDKTVETD